MDTYTGVWRSSNSRTCLVVGGTRTRVRFVMTESSGVEVFEVPCSQFLAAFKCLPDSSEQSAARSMLRYGALVGVTDEARSELLKVIQQEEQTVTKRAIPSSIPRAFTPPEVPAEPKMKKTVTVKVHPPLPPPTKAREYKKGAPVHINGSKTQHVDPQLSSNEFIVHHVKLGANTQWIFDQCKKLYDFGPKQRNTINVYRHRLRASGKLK